MRMVCPRCKMAFEYDAVGLCPGCGTDLPASPDGDSIEIPTDVAADKTTYDLQADAPSRMPWDGACPAASAPPADVWDPHAVGVRQALTDLADPGSPAPPAPPPTTSPAPSTSSLGSWLALGFRGWTGTVVWMILYAMIVFPIVLFCSSVAAGVGWVALFLPDWASIPINIGVDISVAMVAAGLGGGTVLVLIDHLRGESWAFAGFFGAFRRGPWLWGLNWLVNLLLCGWLLPGVAGVVVAFGAGRTDVFVFSLICLALNLLLAFWLSTRVGVFAEPILLDLGCSPIEAVDRSWRLSRGRTGSLIVLSMLTALLRVVGVAFFLVGALFTWPLASCLTIAAYVKSAGDDDHLEEDRRALSPSRRITIIPWLTAVAGWIVGLAMLSEAKPTLRFVLAAIREYLPDRKSVEDDPGSTEWIAFQEGRCRATMPGRPKPFWRPTGPRFQEGGKVIRTGFNEYRVEHDELLFGVGECPSQVFQSPDGVADDLVRDLAEFVGGEVTSNRSSGEPGRPVREFEITIARRSMTVTGKLTVRKRGAAVAYVFRYKGKGAEPAARFLESVEFDFDR